MTQDFAALKAAAIDGRTHNVFHRITQLEKLHNTLRNEAAAIQDAIVADNGSTRAEAAIEYYAAMKCVTNAHASLRPVEALAAEYSIAKGKNAVNNTEPVGIVYVEPCRHTIVFSVISPVSSAIAAGNCVVVLLEQNLHDCNAILRRALSTALEPDSFAIASQRVTTELPASRTVFVLQESDEQLPRSNQLVSTAAPCVAFVDRTASLELAARELVIARVTFAGRSPYAPGIVLVNEFVLKDFLSALMQECINYGRTGVASVNGTTAKIANSRPDRVREGIESLRTKDPDLRIVMHEAKCAIVESVSRNGLLDTYLKAPIIHVHAIRSLDDGIDLVNSRLSVACNATYHFGTSETCKYLSQFIPSAVSFANHVPRELLIGPASPQNHPVDLERRYHPNFFTVSRPQYTVSTCESLELAPAFATADNSVAKQLASEAATEIRKVSRASGKGVGFFEQGFLINASLILVGAVVTTVAGGYTLYTRWRR